MVQAANYSAALHWLRAAKAAGTLDGSEVAARMRAMPVNDFYCKNLAVQANGQLLMPVSVWRVKPAAQAAHRWDFYEPISTLPGADAFIKLADTGCGLS
jgi:branched-chain amino acid transport system substrate-binding protein